MNNRGNIALITLVIVAVLAAGGYWYWQGWYISESDNQNTVVTLGVTDTPTKTPKPPTTDITAFPTPDDLDRWVDSSLNEKRNWSFKYPSSWIEERTWSSGSGYTYRPHTRVWAI